jgi:hypothetical protein
LGRDPADLKSLCLKLLSQLPCPSTFREPLEALLRKIEVHQAPGVLKGKPVVPFVLPWGRRGDPGEWAVEERRPGEDGRAASGALRLRLGTPVLGYRAVAEVLAFLYRLDRDLRK